MKRAPLIIGLLVAVLLAGVVFAIRFFSQAERSAAIDRVLSERERAIQQCLLNHGRSFNFFRFELQLRKIRADDCPKEFRLAWMDYQHAWTQHCKDKHRKDSAEALDLAVGTLAAYASGGLTLADAARTTKKMAEDSKRPVFDTQSFWWTVEKEAVIFDCAVPANTLDF
jgi:hypothetical protein